MCQISKLHDALGMDPTAEASVAVADMGRKSKRQKGMDAEEDFSEAVAADLRKQQAAAVEKCADFACASSISCPHCCMPEGAVGFHMLQMPVFD